MSQYTYSSHGWKSRRPLRSRLPKTGLIKNLVLLAIALGFAGSLALLALFAVASHNLPNPNALTKRSISQTTKIYDRTGEHVLYEIFGNENRTLKKVQEGFCKDDLKLETDPNGIPLFALQATIAAEDRNFCKHGGFDLKGIARAFFQNLTGNRVGGSTLTQQLVKNAILSNEKTLMRKVKELVLSIELERRYHKDEILQIYFNEIPYGSTYYGIEAAAQNFFHTSADKLTLAQAATLAALPKAPTTYLNNPDRLLARRNYVLDQMKGLGFISKEQAVAAEKEQTPIETRLSNIEAPHFVLYVKELLEEKYGQQAVEEGGLKVITTLNYDDQKIAEEEVKKEVEARGKERGFSNAALIALDPKTGQILSMVGSKDYFDDSIDGQVNVTTRLRQPGSSFKPIVYAKAFEMGYTPNTVLWDVETTFPTVTGAYTPHNYDLQERGPVRLRDALQMSLNIPAVKLVYLVGVENALDFATSLGYSTFGDHSAFGLSIVLGGGEVKLIEHTAAYGVFANNGVKMDTVSLLRVEDSDGTVLEEWKPNKGKRVVDENVTRTLTHVLSDNNARIPVFGAASHLQLGDRPVAAKTGTTNDNKDAWLIGYTPSLVVGVWGGNNNNKPMVKGAGGSSVSAPIWNGFMRRALANTPIETFIPPVIKQTGKPILDGQIGSTKAIVDKTTGKLATQYTPESQKEERVFAQYHSILHDVDRANPLGDPPKDPNADPYYTSWEQGIARWIKKQEEKTGKKIVSQDPPTQFDDVHIPENFPTIKWIKPSDGQFVSRNLEAEAFASAPRGIARVEFFVDGFYLGSDNTQPFQFSGTLPSSIDRGLHTLKAVAYDDVENSGSITQNIQVAEEAPEETLSLVDPKNGQTIEQNDEPYRVILSLKHPSQYSSVRLYANPIGPGPRQLIGEQNHPTSVFQTIAWKLPTSGNYALFAEGTTITGATVKTAGITVSVVQKTPQGNTSGTGGELFTPTNPLNLF
ncbi:transglycosylase domain-containing protein [Candidatus Uhrbacteria bacterium]|nr:transglycosylase domain-containing protein [Candidatus Uhrbacteria bacterium]